MPHSQQATPPTTYKRRRRAELRKAGANRHPTSRQVNRPSCQSVSRYLPRRTRHPSRNPGVDLILTKEPKRIRQTTARQPHHPLSQTSAPIHLWLASHIINSDGCGSREETTNQGLCSPLIAPGRPCISRTASIEHSGTR